MPNWLSSMFGGSEAETPAAPGVVAQDPASTTNTLNLSSVSKSATIPARYSAAQQNQLSILQQRSGLNIGSNLTINSQGESLGLPRGSSNRTNEYYDNSSRVADFGNSIAVGSVKDTIVDADEIGPNAMLQNQDGLGLASRLSSPNQMAVGSQATISPSEDYTSTSQQNLQNLHQQQKALNQNQKGQANKVRDILATEDILGSQGQQIGVSSQGTLTVPVPAYGPFNEVRHRDVPGMKASFHTDGMENFMAGGYEPPSAGYDENVEHAVSWRAVWKDRHRCGQPGRSVVSLDHEVKRGAGEHLSKVIKSNHYGLLHHPSVPYSRHHELKKKFLTVEEAYRLHPLSFQQSSHPKSKDAMATPSKLNTNHSLAHSEDELDAIHGSDTEDHLGVSRRYKGQPRSDAMIEHGFFPVPRTSSHARKVVGGSANIAFKRSCSQEDTRMMNPEDFISLRKCRELAKRHLHILEKARHDDLTTGRNPLSHSSQSAAARSAILELGGMALEPKSRWDDCIRAMGSKSAFSQDTMRPPGYFLSETEYERARFNRAAFIPSSANECGLGKRFHGALSHAGGLESPKLPGFTPSSVRSKSQELRYKMGRELMVVEGRCLVKQDYLQAYKTAKKEEHAEWVRIFSPFNARDIPDAERMEKHKGRKLQFTNFSNFSGTGKTMKRFKRNSDRRGIENLEQPWMNQSKNSNLSQSQSQATVLTTKTSIGGGTTEGGDLRTSNGSSSSNGGSNGKSLKTQFTSERIPGTNVKIMSKSQKSPAVPHKHTKKTQEAAALNQARIKSRATNMGSSCVKKSSQSSTHLLDDLARFKSRSTAPGTPGPPPQANRSVSDGTIRPDNLNTCNSKSSSNLGGGVQSFCAEGRPIELGKASTYISPLPLAGVSKQSDADLSESTGSLNSSEMGVQTVTQTAGNGLNAGPYGSGPGLSMPGVSSLTQAQQLQNLQALAASNPAAAALMQHLNVDNPDQNQVLETFVNYLESQFSLRVDAITAAPVTPTGESNSNLEPLTPTVPAGGFPINQNQTRPSAAQTPPSLDLEKYQRYSDDSSQLMADRYTNHAAINVNSEGGGDRTGTVLGNGGAGGVNSSVMMGSDNINASRQAHNQMGDGSNEAPVPTGSQYVSVVNSYNGVPGDRAAMNKNSGVIATGSVVTAGTAAAIIAGDGRTGNWATVVEGAETVMRNTGEGGSGTDSMGTAV